MILKMNFILFFIINTGNFLTRSSFMLFKSSKRGQVKNILIDNNKKPFFTKN